MPVKYPKYRKEVSLIPGGPLQFLDFAFNIHRLPAVKSEFWEYEVQDSGIVEHRLRCLKYDRDSDQYLDRQTRLVATDPRTDRNGPGTGKPIQSLYSRNTERALEPFLGRWMPVPIFRADDIDADGSPRFSNGPSDWARFRVVEKPDDAGNTHVVTVVFDTFFEDSNDVQFDDDGIQPQLTRSNDVDGNAVYVLAHDVAHSSWWLGQEWVVEWVKAAYTDMLRSKRKSTDQESWEFKVDHMARYITFIDVIHAAEIMPRFRLPNPAMHEPIDVDLVLDIGNSRTCGMLIESGNRDAPQMSDSTVLETRDLTSPEIRYQEPFSSHVAFARASFTDLPEDQDGSQPSSGRTREGFDWPTVVRVGPEATLLAARSRREEGQTAMSSPKRYLWDRHPRSIQWRFCPQREDDFARELPVTMGTYSLFINDQGTPLRAFDFPRLVSDPVFRSQQPDPVLNPVFSRSSLMMFLLSEVVLHALVQINSPGYRNDRINPDIPRRLRSIILTMPTAMPIAERKILRTWANWAIETLWQALGWEDLIDDGSGDFRSSPRVRCEWDEATATQLVYLYNEVAEKFAGDVGAYFRIHGRSRPGDDQQTVRVASIDIGGGTTDLIITTYSNQSAGATGVINPKQEFREGFNIAGDHILKAVVEAHFLDALRMALESAGATNARDLLTRRFGRDFTGLSEHERNLRAQFINQVAVPFGLKILAAAENYDLRSGSQLLRSSYVDIFAQNHEPRGDVLEYLAEAAAEAGAPGFDIREFTLEVDLADVATTIAATISPVLFDLCEVVHFWDCDVLVLAGRPSRLPAIHAAILGKAPVPPDRLVALSEYKVGHWYPYWSPGGHISDPKTTACVGAVLCALTEGNLQNFRFETKSLRPRSTARYLGEMEATGQIKESNLFFEAIDMDAPEEDERPAEILFNAPIYIGFRQIKAERWTATPLYSLRFANQRAASNARGRLPYKVQLLYQRKAREESESPDASMMDSQDEGFFSIEEVTCAATGENLRAGELVLELKTMQEEEGHWLDSGILEVR